MATAFHDLPEDALLAILALLPPRDAASAACSCRRLAAAFASPSLPLSLCLRLRLPLPRLPFPADRLAPASSRRLFRSLHRLHRLLGLWRRLAPSPAPSLAAFEWAPRATLAASLLSPSSQGLVVSKTPFLALSVAVSGETVGALGGVPVCVNFVGNNHIVVEAATPGDDDDDEEWMEGRSPPGNGVLEMYAHFANRTNLGARRRRGREGRRRGGGLEAEHFVRIADSEPTKARPLQGLWKVLPFSIKLTPPLLYRVEGICESRTLEFYLVAYDDIGGITCRWVSSAGEKNSGCSPVFWTTNTTFLEPPFSEQELDLYSSREHIQGVGSIHVETESRVVSRILCISSSYDLVDPHLSTSLDDLGNVEGRIWQYEDGTFGFGFLGSNSIVDLRHVASNGCILDTLH